MTTKAKSKKGKKRKKNILPNGQPKLRFPNMFAYILEDKEITQLKISEDLGISYPTINTFHGEKKNQPLKRTLIQIATYLGVTVEELLKTYKPLKKPSEYEFKKYGR